MNHSKRMWIYLLILVGAIIAMLIPFNLVMAPERELKIIDSDGNTVGNAMVRQIWSQYSLDLHGETDFTVNPRGEVSLPERAVRTNIASLISGAVIQIYDLKIHASFRSRERIAIFVPGYPSKWFYDGKGLESGTVVFQ